MVSLRDQVERSDVDSFGSLSGKWAASGAARAASVFQHLSAYVPCSGVAGGTRVTLFHHPAMEWISRLDSSSFESILRVPSRHGVCSHGVVGAFCIRVPSLLQLCRALQFIWQLCLSSSLYFVFVPIELGSYAS